MLNKYDWLLINGETVRVSNELKKFINNLIEMEHHQFYCSLSLEQKKNILGLFLDGLSLSHFNDSLALWLEDCSDNSIGKHYLKHLTKNRSADSIIERMNEILFRNYEETLIEIFNQLQKEHVKEKVKNAKFDNYTPFKIMERMRILAEGIE